MSKPAKKGYTGPRVKDTKTFVQKSRWMHGDAYDYSKSEYSGATNHVTIICKDHGEFEQVANQHTAGSGCKKCGYQSASLIQKYDIERFKSEAYNAHGDTYDYSKVIYNGAFNKVEIVCPVHGSFFQIPGGHIAGKGCMKCAQSKSGESTRLGRDAFVSRAEDTHGFLYDYSKTNYCNIDTPVEIICPIHGSFYQIPYEHLKGGCKKCGHITASEIRRGNVKGFVARATKEHGSTYDYSKVDYKTVHEKVEIICTTHGSFFQTPNSHARGSGCPTCSKSLTGWKAPVYFSEERNSNLYVIKLSDESTNSEFIKVGLASKAEARHKQISKDSGCSVEVLYTLRASGKLVWEIENNIHFYSEFEKYIPEVPFPGSTECYVVGQEEEIIKYIKEGYDV